MGNGDIIFTHKPSALDIGLLNDHDGYHENDLYYLEVCALNELCGNYEEVFRAEVGETFRCRVDAERWAAAAVRGGLESARVRCRWREALVFRRACFGLCQPVHM